MTFRSYLLDYYSWCANPYWYDFIHSINFTEKTATFASGGGQCMSLECNADISITITQQTQSFEKGWFDVKFIEDKSNEYCPIFEPLQRRKLHVMYKLYKGDFWTDGEYVEYRRQYFPARLVFQESCFPFELNPNLYHFLNFVNPTKCQDHWLIFYAQPETETDCQRKKLLEEISYESLGHLRCKNSETLPNDVKLWSWFPTLYSHKFREVYRDLLC